MNEFTQQNFTFPRPLSSLFAMALGGFFGGATKVIDEITGERHSPGVFAEFPSYGSLKNYILEEFNVTTSRVPVLFDNRGHMRMDNDDFDSPPFVILGLGADVFRRFILVYR